MLSTLVSSSMLKRLGVTFRPAVAPRLLSSATATSAAATGQPKIEILEGGRFLSVEWPTDGTKARFHTQWLMHNVDSMQQKYSGQRTMTLAELGERTPLLNASLCKEPSGATCVNLSWHSGVTHRCTTDFLKKHAYPPEAVVQDARSRRPPPLTRNVPTMEYADVMANEQAVWRWLRNMNLYGLCLLRNVPCEAGQVKKVAERVAPVQRTIYGEVFDVVATPKPINVAYSAAALELHMDLVYLESPPGLQLLHCVRFDQDLVGGESTFMDVFHIAELFRTAHPKEFEVLSRVPATFQKIHYDRDYPVHIVCQRPHFQVNHLDELVNVSWAPPFEGPLRVPEDWIEPYYAAYSLFAQFMATVGESHQIEFRMVPGDLVVFNNHRVLHGRRGFSEDAPQGARWLQGCYLNVDEFMSRYQVLNSKYAPDAVVKRAGCMNFY